MTILHLYRLCRFSAISVVTVGFGLGVAPEQRSAPVSIATTSTRTYVLEQNGAVAIADRVSGRFVRTIYRISRPYQAMDLAAIDGASGESVAFVIVHRPLGPRFAAWVLRFNGDHEPEWIALKTNGISGGVAAESETVAVLSNATTGEIYHVNTSDRTQRRVSREPVPGSGTIGPLFIDRQGGRVVAADSEGDVYAVDVSGGKWQRIASCPNSDIRAMTLNQSERRIYLADANRESVMSIDLSVVQTRCNEFVKDKRFSAPAGISIDQRGTMWVADMGARKIFRIGGERQGVIGDPVDW